MIYEISGILEVPDGRVAVVKAVWIIGVGETVPCFVTAMAD
jgi:hypothetical protein